MCIYFLTVHGACGPYVSAAGQDSWCRVQLGCRLPKLSWLSACIAQISLLLLCVVGTLHNCRVAWLTPAVCTATSRVCGPQIWEDQVG